MFHTMRSKLETPVSEFEMISLVKKNLRKQIFSIVYSVNISSLEQFRVECIEVELMKFTTITDHANLKWLMSLKDLSKRLASWLSQLQTYGFSIGNRKGSENVVANMLSRMPFNSEIMIEEILCFGF